MSAILKPQPMALAAPPVETQHEEMDLFLGAPKEPQPRSAERLGSLDAFRGLVMVLMISAGLGIPEVVRNFERSPALRHLKTPLWERLAYQTDHVEWTGCVLWDLIQPSFMFMVGVAMVFSLAGRRAKGHSFLRMLGHAVWRSGVLVLLAVFLSTESKRPGTNWVFTNVLAQIGLGYTFLFLIARLKPGWQFLAALVILATYWGAFVMYPKPAADFDLAKAGLPADWHRLEGFAAHWERNANIAWRVDHWFLNKFPRSKPWEFSDGGYATLNFVPSLATMIFGLLAGGLLRGKLTAGAKFGILLAGGIAAIAVGWSLGHFGVCPIIKRIWTPSWAIYSAGFAAAALAVFYLVIDIARLRKWALPLTVVGMNSIVAYYMFQALGSWFRENVNQHFGKRAFMVFGDAFVPMVQRGSFLLFCWIVCAWMYRRKFFVRI